MAYGQAGAIAGQALGQGGAGQLNPMASLFSLIGQDIGDFHFGHGEGDIAQYLQQLLSGGMNNFAPFIGGGAQGMSNENAFMQQLMGKASAFNPQQTYDQWTKNYQETPYAKFMTGQALNTLNNAAAIGGTLGSGQNALNNATIANNVISGDFQNYMHNLIGLQNYGLGLDQLVSSGNLGMAGIGGQAASNAGWFTQGMGDQIGTMMQNQNEANSAGLSGIFSILGNIF